MKKIIYYTFLIFIMIFNMSYSDGLLLFDQEELMRSSASSFEGKTSGENDERADKNTEKQRGDIADENSNSQNSPYFSIRQGLGIGIEARALELGWMCLAILRNLYFQKKSSILVSTSPTPSMEKEISYKPFASTSLMNINYFDRAAAAYIFYCKIADEKKLNCEYRIQGENNNEHNAIKIPELKNEYFRSVKIKSIEMSITSKPILFDKYFLNIYYLTEEGSLNTLIYSFTINKNSNIFFLEKEPKIVSLTKDKVIYFYLFKTFNGYWKNYIVTQNIALNEKKIIKIMYSNDENTSISTDILHFSSQNLKYSPHPIKKSMSSISTYFSYMCFIYGKDHALSCGLFDEGLNDDAPPLCSYQEKKKWFPEGLPPLSQVRANHLSVCALSQEKSLFCWQLSESRNHNIINYYDLSRAENVIHFELGDHILSLVTQKPGEAKRVDFYDNNLSDSFEWKAASWIKEDSFLGEGQSRFMTLIPFPFYSFSKAALGMSLFYSQETNSFSSKNWEPVIFNKNDHPLQLTQPHDLIK